VDIKTGTVERARQQPWSSDMVHVDDTVPQLSSVQGIGAW